MPAGAKKTPILALIAAWTIVMIPLCWGVGQSVIKSLPLFQAPGAPAQRR
jgi:hypothetical protein